MHRRRRIGHLLVAIATFVGLLLPALPALPASTVAAQTPPAPSAARVAAAPPPGAYSANIWTSPDGNRLKFGIAGHMWWLDLRLDEFIAYYRQLGITNVRLSLDWKKIEAQQGRYDFAQTDRVLNRLAAENIEVIASFVTAPAWATTNPAACARAQQTPDRERLECGISPAAEPQFRAATRATATRYPFIRLWEFWNEPELWTYGGKEVGDYLRWLKPFYEEIHAVQPGAVVAANTLAGVFYVDWLYGASDNQNTAAKRPWDAISFHPYAAIMATRSEAQVVPLFVSTIGDVRKRMVDAGEGHKKLWITEYGWETDPASSAKYLTQGLGWLVAQDYVEVANLHMLHDWTGEHFGLLGTQIPIYNTGSEITAQTVFVPKEPYFGTFRNYPKPAASRAPTATGLLAFPQVGHAVQAEFRLAWEQLGGMTTLGLPRTGEYPRKDARDGLYYRTQEFERGRLISRPAANGQPPRVELDTITDGLLAPKGLTDAPGSEVAPPFRERWQAMGGAGFLGTARTGLLTEGGASVQYFARGRLELRGGGVSLGLVGMESLMAQGWLDGGGGAIPGTPAAREWAG